MMFTFEQITGKWRDDSGVLIGIGYSGAGVGKNNPSMEGIVDVGPIPCGNYLIKGPPFDSPKHGKFVLYLVPDADTKARIIAYGRDPNTFLLHGDSIENAGTASQGCVIQDRGTREAVWAANAMDNGLRVIAGVINA
jgi:hypothetical protein